MGCGALCGDVATLETAVNRNNKLILDRLATEIARNQEMASSHPFSHFLDTYQHRPAELFLQTRQKPTKEDIVSADVLVKWRVVVLGGEKVDKQYRECLGLPIDWTIKYSNSDHKQEGGSLIYHEVWKQIEKDIGRTFKAFEPHQPSQQTLREFALILKRITNHFPKMGYCQSLNFVIGYLLVLGFSQQDSFQVFVHLATSRRYLLLGMYEDKFPLYNVLFLIFRNAFTRMNPVLSSHMFEMPDFTHHLWLFKWLSNLFIDFLPNEILPFVWDFVIMIGTLGMIIAAISILQLLQSTILAFNDVGDLHDFFKSLKNLDIFNEKVNLHQLMIKVYQIELVEKDFQNVELEGGFYGIFIKAQFKKGGKDNRMLRVHDGLESRDSDNEKAQKMLQSWRNDLIEERNTFIMNHQKGKKVEQENEDIEVVIIEPPKKEKEETQPTALFRNELRMNRVHKVEYQFNEINEKVEEEEQSVRSSSSKPKLPIVGPEGNGFDQLSKLQLQFNARKGKTPQADTNSQTVRLVKINNFNVSQHNTLSLAGRLAMKNEPSFDAISISSKRNSNKSQIKSNNQKAPIPKTNRVCGCKTKTQENKCMSFDQNSELGQSKYQSSEKDSVSINNYSHKSQANDPQSLGNNDTHRERMSTHANYMANSHCPSFANQGRIDTDSEVVVYPFKKNKRARINLMAAQLPKRDFKSKIRWQPQEESIEQISHLELPSKSVHCCDVSSMA